MAVHVRDDSPLVTVVTARGREGKSKAPRLPRGSAALGASLPRDAAGGFLSQETRGPAPSSRAVVRCTASPYMPPGKGPPLFSPPRFPVRAVAEQRAKLTSVAPPPAGSPRGLQTAARSLSMAAPDAPGPMRLPFPTKPVPRLEMSDPQAFELIKRGEPVLLTNVSPVKPLVSPCPPGRGTARRRCGAACLSG